ncbi:hypothetical protein [Mucilaginibacter ginsenosidivorax]|uniref:hypothetical protein n=1 Tax=Mucilaginibacter ginsenosidivorax TaxID=862126 RepID=UPI0013154229|nr:hypothetical protein [Mucilaginibacter ginsenosidivorax]
MEISDRDLQTFIDLFAKEYNVVLSKGEAAEKLSRLRRLYRVLYLAPIPPEYKNMIEWP